MMFVFCLVFNVLILSSSFTHPLCLFGFLFSNATPQKTKTVFDSDTSQGHSFTCNPYDFHAMVKPIFMV